MNRKRTGKNIIEINKLSKIFEIPHEKRSTLAESIIGAITKGRVKYEKFYALRNINLAVKRGEFLGIIGPNGSGKTTLLKVVAGILEPNKGSIEVEGKVVPFLELGIGFVQELTAKENIYLYGSLLGLTRKQVDERFNKIIGFAEIKKFIDTPLKDFSTGMLARLAFSIAKEAEGDTYLIDEVLAVGDEEFQKKCVGVFEEFKAKGKTVLFVSHNTDLVAKLCNRIVYLDAGKIKKIGSPRIVAGYYKKKVISKQKAGEQDRIKELAKTIKQKDEKITLLETEISKKLEHEKQTGDLRKFFTAKNRWGSGDVKITKVRTLDKKSKEKKVFQTGNFIKIRIFYKVKKKIANPEVGIGIYNENAVLLAGPNTYFSKCMRPFNKGKGCVDYIIDKLNLLEGKYKVHVAISKAPAKDTESNYDYRVNAATFEIRNKDFPEKYGLVALNGRWMYKKV